MSEPKDKEKNRPSYLKFVEAFLKEDPNKLMFTEMGTTLADYMNAFTKMKKDGDIPSINGYFLYQSFQNCLIFSLQERLIKENKLTN